MIALGLMSGTSMDGIDGVIIDTDGMAQVKVLGHYSYNYPNNMRILLKAAEYAVRQEQGNLLAANQHFVRYLQHYIQHELNIADSESLSQELAELLQTNANHLSLTQVTQLSTQLHLHVIQQLLTKYHFTAQDIELIGYHGQTLYHNAEQQCSVQVGNSAWLQQQLGIPVISNFRENDLLHGGLGAPLAPIYHHALTQRDHLSPAVVVNCGGITNLTLINQTQETALLGFDVGPGNVLIDRFVKMRTHGEQTMDYNGHFGMNGQVNQTILQLLWQKACVINGENFFYKLPPKSLDGHDLQLITELQQLSLADGAATLAAFTANTLVASIELLPPNTVPNHWILTGGGWKNPVILRELKQMLHAKYANNVSVKLAQEVGWDGQTIEAELMAYLAVRCYQQLPITFPGTTQVSQPLCGGKIYL